MQKCLSLSDLYTLARLFEMGLTSGKDIRQSLIEMQSMPSSHSISCFSQRLLRLTQDERFKDALVKLQTPQKNFMERLLLDILSLTEGGVHNLSKALAQYRELIKVLIRIERESKGLLFLPKFQGCVGVIVAVLFSLVLPFVWPAQFPSFLNSNNESLFLAGLSGCAAGLFLLYSMSRTPEKKLRIAVRRFVFISLQSVFIRSGLDFISAWNRSLKLTQFTSSEEKILMIPEAKADRVPERIDHMARDLSTDWKELLLSLQWILSSGVQISDRLIDLANLEREKIEFESLHHLRRMAALTLVPVQVMIFPSALFLLLGPQLMEILK